MAEKKLIFQKSAKSYKKSNKKSVHEEYCKEDVGKISASYGK